MLKHSRRLKALACAHAHRRFGPAFYSCGVQSVSALLDASHMSRPVPMRPAWPRRCRVSGSNHATALATHRPAIRPLRQRRCLRGQHGQVVQRQEGVAQLRGRRLQQASAHAHAIVDQPFSFLQCQVSVRIQRQACECPTERRPASRHRLRGQHGQVVQRQEDVVQLRGRRLQQARRHGRKHERPQRHAARLLARDSPSAVEHKHILCGQKV